jgi:hypothetical protein
MEDETGKDVIKKEEIRIMSKKETKDRLEE